MSRVVKISKSKGLMMRFGSIAPAITFVKNKKDGTLWWKSEWKAARIFRILLANPMTS